MCRLELTQSLFLRLIQRIGALYPWIRLCWPEWFLPPTVTLKTQNDGWTDEFITNIKAYNLLKPLQGTVIPHFYGEAVYDGSPALVISAIASSNLFDLTRNKFPESKDQALQETLDNVMKALTSYGVEYIDQRLDNFLWTDSERVMIIDLELVEFGTTKIWERSVNRTSPESLIDEFRRTRDPERLSRYRRALYHLLPR